MPFYLQDIRISIEYVPKNLWLYAMNAFSFIRNADFPRGLHQHTRAMILKERGKNRKINFCSKRKLPVFFCRKTSQRHWELAGNMMLINVPCLLSALSVLHCIYRFKIKVVILCL